MSASNESNVPIRLSQAFAKYDTNGDGVISPDEFSKLLDDIGSDLSATDRELGFRFIDEDDSGSVSLAELKKWWEVIRAS